MRRGIHCPRCGELLVAFNDDDLFLVLRQHIDEHHTTRQIDDDVVYELIALLAHDVL